MLTFTVTGPYNPGGSGDTPSRQTDLHVPPGCQGDAAGRGSVRHAHPLHTGPPRLPRAGHRRRHAAADDVLPRGAAARRLRGRHRSRRCSAFWPARSSSSASSATPQTVKAGERLSRSAISSWRRGSRSSSGAACPTISCCRWPAQGGCARRACSSARSGACWPTRGPSACPPTSPASGCFCATCARSSRTRWSSPTSTTTCAARLEHEAWMFFDSIRREDRNVMDLMNADYTFVNERAGEALRHPQRLRQPLAEGDADRRGAAGAARQGARSSR